MQRSKGFIVVSEQILLDHESNLRLAARSLKAEFSLPLSGDEITRHLMATTRLLPNLTSANPELVEEMLVDGLKEAADAIRTHLPTKSAREARQLAKFALTQRRNRRGAPDKYDPEIVMAFCATVERIVGRKLTVSHRRNSNPGRGESETGPPEGPMLEVLLAALNWVFTEFRPYLNLCPVNAEGVLTIIRKARSSAGHI